MEFAGQPITYVEIGCWEGMSASWVAENVLTHEDSRGYGIDPYEELKRGMLDDGNVRHTQKEMNAVLI